MNQTTTDNNRNDKGQFKPGNNAGKQFSAEHQPETSGRKGKKVTTYLKEIGEADAIEFTITLKSKKGKKDKTRTHKIEIGENSKGEKGTINQALAGMMMIDALQGDNRARKEILDRTEGRPASYIDITSDGEKITLTQQERESKLAKIFAKLGKRQTQKQ